MSFVVCIRRTRGHVTVPELHRSKFVAAEKCVMLNDLDSDCRRKSCNFRAHNTPYDLFVVDDVRYDSINLGFLTVPESVVEAREEGDDDEDDIGGEIRMSRVLDDNDKIRVSNDGETEEGDLKIMKEIIEMELTNKRMKFWDAASVSVRNYENGSKSRRKRCINGGTDNTMSKLGQLGQFSEFRDNQSEVEDNKS